MLIVFSVAAGLAITEVAMKPWLVKLMEAANEFYRRQKNK